MRFRSIFIPMVNYLVYLPNHDSINKNEIHEIHERIFYNQVGLAFKEANYWPKSWHVQKFFQSYFLLSYY